MDFCLRPPLPYGLFTKIQKYKNTKIQKYKKYKNTKIQIYKFYQVLLCSTIYSTFYSTILLFKILFYFFTLCSRIGTKDCFCTIVQLSPSTLNSVNPQCVHILQFTVTVTVHCDSSPFQYTVNSLQCLHPPQHPPVIPVIKIVCAPIENTETGTEYKPLP